MVFCVSKSSAAEHERIRPLERNERVYGEILIPYPLSFYRIPLTHPLRKPSLKSENLSIPKANCRDRGLHARISPGAPAVKHESRVLCRRKDKLEGIKLFFWYKL